MGVATKIPKRPVTEVAPTVRREHRFDPERGRASTFLIAVCKSCDAEFAYRVGHAKNTREGSDERMMAQRMRAAGWDVTNDLRKPVCAGCMAKRKPPPGAVVLEAVAVAHVETIGPRGGFSPPIGTIHRIAGPAEPPAQEPNMPQEAAARPMVLVTETPKADPPPKMNPGQRRMIFDALDEAYDTAALGYRPPHTDATIAKRLDMPRLWIAEVRELMFGPALSVSKLANQLDSIMRRVDSVETTVLKATESLDQLRAEAKAIAEALGAQVAK